MSEFRNISKRANQMNKFMVWGCCCLVSTAVQAGNYYADHAVGWFWYDDPIEVTQDHRIQPTSASTDPNIIVHAAKEKVNTALNQAIVSPTIANITKYIELQEAMGSRAELISVLWQQALLKRPDLNYSLKHPTNNVALQVYHEQESRGKETAISEFAKKTGLFFFYKSSCPYCQRFAPILKNFAARYGMTVIPVTMDGIPLPEFPDSRSDNGQSTKFHVKVTPSLFAVNPYTQQAFPVAYGLTSETELRENIYKMMSRDGKL